MKFLIFSIILFMVVLDSMSFMKRRKKAFKKMKKRRDEEIVEKPLTLWSGENYPFIWKDSYGRQAGKIPNICERGKEYQDGLCYKRCDYGYHPVGPVCWGECAEGYADHGATCFKHLFDFYGKDSKGRGAGTVPNECGLNEDYDAGLCYTKCKEGYYGVGPVCWQSCPKRTPFDCGAACSGNSSDCASSLFGFLKSLFTISQNISEEITTNIGPVEEITASDELSTKAVFTAAQIFAREGASQDAVKKSITDTVAEAGDTINPETVKKIVSSSFKFGGFNFSDFSNINLSGVKSYVKGFTKRD